jgi:hypothetical protein
LRVEPAPSKLVSSLSASKTSRWFRAGQVAGDLAPVRREFALGLRAESGKRPGIFSFGLESIHPPSQWMLTTQNMSASRIQSTTSATRLSLSGWMRPALA